MDGVLRWDCVCDACDPHGRYHAIPQGRGDATPTPPRWPKWLLFLALLGVLLAIGYCRGILP